MVVALDVVVFALGAGLVAFTLSAAVRAVVVPRATPVLLTRVVFVGIRRIFNLWAKRVDSYEERDRVMALYAPLSLLSLAFVWLILVLAGYTAMFWAIGNNSLRAAFRLSGSSIVTLGFAPFADLPTTVLGISEAGLGLSLLALLITYLPSVYSTFSRREQVVALLEVRAGSPPSAAELIERFARIEWLDRLHDLWAQWESWFVDIEETHTSLPALVFFRSPQHDRSWVTAAGAMLDTASFVASTFPDRHPDAELCVRSGAIALRRIADFFEVPYDPNPKRGDPISVSREEYEEMHARVMRAGVDLRPATEETWLDFAGWRVNYDIVLLSLASITMAPYAPWSSDRSLAVRRAAFTSWGRRRRGARR
ncbi:MAG: hypothetical protein E6G06_12040 [Actinobacteria bacterium]|nr:MAG: hypothetical protein E6G06_12040 [Actinomycetota bacterium]